MPLLLTNSASKLFGMATAGYYSSSDESCLFGAEYLKKVMIQIALNQQRMIIPTTIVTIVNVSWCNAGAQFGTHVL